MQNLLILLKETGYNILEIFTNNESRFFIIKGFVEPQASSAEAIKQALVKGAVEISDFLNQNFIDLKNQKAVEALLVNFEIYLNSRFEFNFKFSDNISWILYSTKF